jgi:hypothetical protein
MPRYFFHHHSDVRITDDTGVEFETPQEARREAIRSAGELLCDAAEPFWGSRLFIVTVTNEVGLIMWEIYMDGFNAAASPIGDQGLG